MKTKPFAKGRLRLSLAILLGGLLLCGMAVGGYCLFLQWSGNFHAVVEGELYRSAQLKPEDIEAVRKKYGIKTIVNLRGANKGRDWYDAEIAESQKNGIAHIDFGISAVRPLSKARANELIETMRSAEKPLLIHCKAGADRAGLASALYLAALKRGTEAEAESQISIKYGHFSLPFLGEYNMDRTFENLEASLGYEP